jgi:oligopeptide transport system ATP-binding protein
VSAVLQVEGLRIKLRTQAGPATVVDGIDYRVEPGEVFGIAGESGSGKTMSVLALMGLLPPGAAVEGSAAFQGRDLLRLPRRQFSGGMRQRIAIAIALACRPSLLVADEPTTALDVTVQAGIIRLLDRLRRESGLSIVLITHDLGVLSAIADRVAVFYAGRVAEAGGREDVLSRPRHPYTRGLLDALPHPDAAEAPLVAIPGAPPTPRRVPPGCAFHPRCGYAQASCSEAVPALVPVDGRLLACPVDPFRG